MKPKIRLASVLAFLVCLAFLPTPARAQTLVLLNDFEDTTTQAWIPRGGGVILTNTDEVGSRTGGAGIRSLRTTNRTQGFHGPSLNVLPLLTKGATYQFSVWVRLVAGQAAANVRMTVQRTVNGANSFDSVGPNPSVTDTAWTQLTGLYAFAGTDPTGLLLYVESGTATASYYIDDFRIDKIADPPGPPPNTTGLSTNFETGTAEGWTPRIGNEGLTPTQADAHTGSFSLLTTNRTTAFRGPSFNVTNIMFNGSRYRVSVWVKLAPGEAPGLFRVSLQRNAGTVSSFHTVVPNTNVTADAWVRLVVNYDVALANSSLFLYVESQTSLASLYIDDVQITYLPPPTIEPDLPSLHEELSDFFPIGAAVRNATVAGVHGDLLKKHFNSMTSENDMKWDATEPQEGNFTFGNADQQVSFAEQNGMLIRGHTLLWHQQTPAWVFNDPLTGQPMLPTPANKALLLTRLQNHIQGVVSHFGDKVYAWDVANEVIDENQPDCMRRSPWFNITGKDYLATAFHTARAVAPPGTLLFINDFNSTLPAKRQCLFNLTSELLALGVPIDGVGHQMHNNFEFPPVQTMVDTLVLFDDLGVTQHVTEMDVNIYSGSANTSIPNYDEIPLDRFVRQARHYRDYFRVFKEHKDKLTSVTMWGLADDSTWLNQVGRINAPLLFDDQLQHKLAYTAIVSPEDLPKDPATVTLSGLSHVYDGSPHPATVTTAPPGLPVVVTYNGSPAPPVNAGTYAVVADIDSEDFAGSATGTLVIDPAQATIVLGSLTATYDGNPHAVSVLTAPPGLAVAVTYDGSLVAPTNAGTYAVAAVVTDPNYVGAASATLTIAKATAGISFGGLLQVYDGSPRPVTVTTQPPGLAVQVTYDGSATPPTMPGSYAVLATVVDANYEGSASATLVITTTALVRHAPVVNGRLTGSLQLLLGESTTLNSSASVSGDFLVPGTPTVRLNGSPAYGGTTDSTGSASPTGYTLTLNGGAALRHVVRRVDALPFPTVAPPPSPGGTRDVVLNNAGQSPGNFATIRNLTLNSNAGLRTVPPGTYGTFLANGSSGFILGVAGATTPSVYNLQGLTLNSGASLQVVGPVTLTLASGVTLNASAGNAANPQWLTLAIASGGLTLNSGATLHGLVTVPLGTVTLNGRLNGRVRADRLAINGAGSLNNAP